MAENKEGQERSEDPTAKRMLEAQQRGQVAKSTDVTSAAMLLVGGVIVYQFGSSMMQSIQDFMELLIRNSSRIFLDDSNMAGYFDQLMFFMALLVAPIMLIIFTIALIAEISQVGLKVATKKFTEGLNFKKIFNPFPGLRRLILSDRTAFELVKSIFKVAIIGTLVYFILRDEIETLIQLITLPYQAIGPFMAELSFELVYKVALIYILIAVADFFYQKYRHKEDLKMTKQDVKDENKQLEGDLKAKARFRQLGVKRIQRLMLKNVREADVVITNPTHFAVALKYAPGKMEAPQVVAKGADFMAKRIIKIARDNDIPVVEDKPLARALYKLVDIGDFVPESLFRTVAQVLAYVYRLNRKQPQEA